MEDSGIDSGDHNGDNNPKSSQNGERIFTVRMFRKRKEIKRFFVLQILNECEVTLKVRLVSL